MGKRACVADGAAEFPPGFYAISWDELSVTAESSVESETVETLARGSIVQVLEVASMSKEERIRGRIAQGWISLKRTDLERDFVTRKNFVCSESRLARALRQCEPLSQMLVGCQNQQGLLSSPYDWLPLCSLAKGFVHLKAENGPLQKVVERFREKTNDDLQQLASVSDPTCFDADCLFFALKRKGFGRRRSDRGYRYGRKTATVEISEQGCAALAKMLPLSDDALLDLLWARDIISPMDRIVFVDGIEAVLRAMEDFSDSSQVQEHGCHILAAFADTFHRFRDEDLGHRYIFAVISAMEGHPGALRVQELACRAMRQRELNFSSAGGIETILGAMKDHPNQIHLQTEACKTLADWVSTKDYAHLERAVALRNCTHIVESDGLDLIFTAIERYPPHDLQVRKSACSLIMRMLETNPAGVKYGLAHRLSQLVNCIAYNSVAINVLEHLSACPDIALKFRESDVQAIMQKIDSYNVEALAIRVLANLCKEPRWSDFIAQAGGFKKIVNAMEVDARNQRSSSSLQEAGCLALCHLIGKEQHQRTRGFRAVLQAMREYPDNVALQCHGLAFAENTCESHGIALRLGAFGGFQVMVSAVGRHAKNVEVLVQGLRTLTALAKQKENKAEIAALGFVDTLVETMEHHHMAQDIQQSGRQLLRSLCACDNAKSQSNSLRAIAFFL